jgi:hypothetical protein
MIGNKFFTNNLKMRFSNDLPKTMRTNIARANGEAPLDHIVT